MTGPLYRPISQVQSLNNIDYHYTFLSWNVFKLFMYVTRNIVNIGILIMFVDPPSFKIEYFFANI